MVSTPLTQGRPLWELTFVSGLESGEVAVIEKLHHSMADGLAAAELAMVLLDVSPVSSVHPPDRLMVARGCSAVGGRRRGDLWRLGAIGVRLGAWAGWTALHPFDAARMWSTKLNAAAGMLRAGPLAPPSPLNRQIGPSRQIRVGSIPARGRAHHRAYLGGNRQ